MNQFLRRLHYTDRYDECIDKIAGLDFLIVIGFLSLCFSPNTLTPFLTIKLNA